MAGQEQSQPRANVVLESLLVWYFEWLQRVKSGRSRRASIDPSQT